MTLDKDTLREYMTLTGVVEIVDNQFTKAIEDATTIKGDLTSSETTLKFFSAYLLAKSVDWTKLKKTGDTEFQKPNPDTYLDLFEMSLDSEARIAGDGSADGMLINSDPKYN